MGDEEAQDVSPVKEQKVLAGDVSRPVSPIEHFSDAAETLDGPSAGVMRRNSVYDSQRVEKRPASSASQSPAKAKGKKSTVDFRDPPEEVLPQGEASTSDATARPAHSRGNSYTNFSRPDNPVRSTSRPADVIGSSSSKPGNVKGKASIVTLPTHQEPTNKQSRLSGTSTVTSRKFRPPVHQADLEVGKSSDESAPLPPFAQSLPTDFLPSKSAPEEVTGWLAELYIVSYLIFFAFLGTLARLGLEWLTYYPGAIITTPIVWPNLAGSLLMGFFVEDSRFFRDHWPDHISTTSRAEKRISKQSSKSRRSFMSGDFDYMRRKERLKMKSSIPLYVGVTTGFCGCFTSFSVWARDMFLAISNDLPAPPYQSAATATLPRLGGYSFMALLAVIITEFAISIGGFLAGRQMALLFEDYTPRMSIRFTRKFLDRLIVVLGPGCWLGAIFLLIWPPDRPGGPQGDGNWADETWRGTVLFSMVFSPLGCLLRYFASKKLNKLEPSFPLGTFAVNMLGVAVLAACYDVQHIGIGDSGIIGGSLLSCQALEGIIDGFTGCLTTVSTFVAELDALKRKYAWIYALSTVLAGLALMVAILGPVRWTVGWSSASCVVGYVNKYG